ncbi:hypothetical protein [Lysobacter gummosus]|uniref:hypothetical protein n=1 Tax=Lysobacter gummosus TaxID=262324 RepID=UPI003635DC38
MRSGTRTDSSFRSAELQLHDGCNKVRHDTFVSLALCFATSTTISTHRPKVTQTAGPLLPQRLPTDRPTLANCSMTRLIEAW